MQAAAYIDAVQWQLYSNGWGVGDFHRNGGVCMVTTYTRTKNRAR
jgi:hypothetical protein